MLSAFLIAALVTQESDDGVIEARILNDCPLERADCVLAHPRWDFDNPDVPAVSSVPDERGYGWIERRFRAEARIDGGPPQLTDIVFTDDDVMFCNDFGGAGFWPITGWSDAGNVIVFTDQGEAELIIPGLQALRSRDENYHYALTLIDAESFEIVGKVYEPRSYSPIYVFSRDLIVMRSGSFSSDHCVRAKSTGEGRFEALADEECERLYASYREPEVIEDENLRAHIRDALIDTHPTESVLDPFAYEDDPDREDRWTYWVYRLPEDPTTLIVDGRIACT